MTDARSLPGTLLAALTLVASVATAGSLYFSLGLGLVPCELCWYQRILMYPLVVVGGVAALERRVGVWRTVLPLSLGGLAVAAYHVYLQVTPAAAGSCSIGGGCSAVLYPMLGGVLTIPRLSMLAFTLVSLLGLGLARLERGETESANPWL
ncbi:disulfide bond formation protein B [Salinigranum rubrum]|uniref:Disulfide bond formation protein B n=1 Tax=Salinigranum rubrum TaxID=755307 RepID=A0A2I8VJW3_9EURY|nr:disulfide bond formation protein B [Salinigranum rubrum]AUV82223.1 disulfide bond formation protein B [Salinigranum rubrum]